ncbi:hypothetical protein HD806DRAFT_501976 [Xylariaceae sp. AK1471]|nr:hypothetical protein HD806DRAFT_501976 [Xylariaceae sp. AK1471]
MPDHSQDDEQQCSAQVLDYSCSAWMMSSQQAADIYYSGVKLWTKTDLVEIEQQVSQSYSLEHFTIRCIDGRTILVKNPLFGVKKPIWRPYVKFQDYWQLVRKKPDGPPETWHCSYLVDWTNETMGEFDGMIKNPKLLFQQRNRTWSQSASCKLFKAQLKKLLGARKVTKVICFGLGDISRRPPAWWREQNAKGTQESESSQMRGALVQHSVAITMADFIRNETGKPVRLLTQDPRFLDESQSILEEEGFEVIGRAGAGGFAEIDEESVVFSAYVAAPLKQIISDVARPALIFVTNSDVLLNEKDQLYRDADSPRSRQMWKEYTRWNFDIAPDGEELNQHLREIGIYARKAIDFSSTVDTRLEDSNLQALQ